MPFAARQLGFNPAAYGRNCTTSKSVPGGAPGPKGGGKPRSNLPLTRARVLPWRATVVGTLKRSEVMTLTT